MVVKGDSREQERDKSRCRCRQIQVTSVGGMYRFCDLGQGCGTGKEETCMTGADADDMKSRKSDTSYRTFLFNQLPARCTTYHRP
jgi:hypothetical protein